MNMVKYEYKIIEKPAHQNGIEEFLNEEGEQGWELHDTFRFADRIRYTFKRQKNNLLTS